MLVHARKGSGTVQGLEEKRAKVPWVLDNVRPTGNPADEGLLWIVLEQMLFIGRIRGRTHMAQVKECRLKKSRKCHF